jgi:hypothetical protein
MARAPILKSMILALLVALAQEPAILEPGALVLAEPDRPEWDEFAGRPTRGRRFEATFEASGARTLLIHQRDVKLAWSVQLNGRKLGELVPMEAPLVHALAVPADALRAGPNVLSIVPPAGPDSIVLGPIALEARPLARAGLTVRVTEEGAPVPCRLTVVDASGYLAPLSARPGQTLAVRPGVVYTPDGRARLGLPPGRYRVTASRGPAYGIDVRPVDLAEGAEGELALAIRRELPTPGWIACDPHVHTREHSGHGDATAEERVLTLAGEGIDLAIATEHNLHASYAAEIDRLGLGRFVASIGGNEVTTRRGHFNAFPMAGTPPDARQERWGPLGESIRAAGARVVILNHPHDLHSGFRPFDPAHFNPVSGEGLEAPIFDAVEVVNSGALRSDLMQNFRSWFALLNAGRRVAAVGASDSHDVARYIVGQGRTYVAGKPEESFRAVSLGLVVDLKLDDRFGIGELAGGLGPTIEIAAVVRGASWVRADRLELYVNGVLARSEAIEPTDRVEKAARRWTLPKPAHDVWIVAVATGPGVTALHWAIPKPYQPDGPAWTPRVLGATNPIWVDADGDGAFSPAREVARRLGARLGDCDEAVAAQAAYLMHAAGRPPEPPPGASEAVRRGFSAYAATLR